MDSGVLINATATTTVGVVTAYLLWRSKRSEKPHQDYIDFNSENERLRRVVKDRDAQADEFNEEKLNLWARIAWLTNGAWTLVAQLYAAGIEPKWTPSEKPPSSVTEAVAPKAP